MAIVINTNLASLDAQRNLANTQNALNTAMQQLSSGYRINSAADDAAGLAISTKMNVDVASSNQASRNAMDGVSLIQTAEGGYSQLSNILTQLRQLAVQSANGTLQNSDRDAIATEATSLTQEITRMANVVQFNGVSLLAGNSAGAAISFTLQVGIGTTSNDTVQITIQPAVASAMGSAAVDLTAISLTSASGAQSALTTIDQAVTAVNTGQAVLGGDQNRLQSAVSDLAVMVENLSAAQSRIQDVDVAQATAALTRSQVLAQAGVAVLAQANQLPALALKLLQ